MLKVAVIGASGFIGSRAVEILHLRGLAEVRPVVRTYSSLARVSRFNLDARVADALDKTAMRQALDGCDVVVHSVLGDPPVITGTVAPVYEAAQQSGVKRVVYLSSIAVHGLAPPPGTNESSPLSLTQPLPYSRAKIRAEQRLLRLREKGSVEVVILRPGIVFGPRSRWTAELADQLLQGTACLVDDGQGICNTTYVDNLVEAIFLAATVNNVDGQAFLIGDRETVTWADFYAPVAAAFGVELNEIPRVDVPQGAQDLRELVERIRVSSPVQGVAPFVPARLKRAIKAGVKGLIAPPAASEWSRPEPPAPAVSKEAALLQRCRYKVPCAKAESMLGYQARVPFAEGCRRSIGWLAFAGYPVLPHSWLDSGRIEGCVP
ncbi:MAG TPA: NAD(P)-dependent oxidoreductase [Candidatus Obscuribacterales bacterium]